MATVTCSAFLASKVAPILLDVIELYGLMALFSSACFIGAVVIVLVLPETKGKDLVEVDGTS
jgi:hypothetical protein